MAAQVPLKARKTGSNVDALGEFESTDTIAKAYIDTAIARKDEKQTFTAQQAPMQGNLTDGATVAWDTDVSGQVVSLTIGGNRTISDPTNCSLNSFYVLRVVQDGVGGRTLAWGSAYKFPNGDLPVLTATANAVDIFTFQSSAAGASLRCIGQALDVR